MFVIEGCHSAQFFYSINNRLSIRHQAISIRAQGCSISRTANDQGGVRETPASSPALSVVQNKQQADQRLCLCHHTVTSCAAPPSTDPAAAPHTAHTLSQKPRCIGGTSCTHLC